MNGVPLIDAILVLALLWIGWRVLVTPYLFNAVVLFIVFGLLMALAWVRLSAPDIALAEAAIGAGLTGALLLDAVAHLDIQYRQKAKRAVHWALRSAVSVLALALVAVLAQAIAVLAPLDVALRLEVAARLPQSGVEHAVTAVLLNFRGYDTLLEIGVLLVAALSVLSLYKDERSAGGAARSANPVLAELTAVVVPVMVLVAGYLLWAGSHQPGGAFQAGAVLAAAGVLLRLTGKVPAVAVPSAALRIGLALGFAVFLAVAAGALGRGALLQYPPAWAGALILLIEATLTVSIALILVVLFAAAPARDMARVRD